MRSGLAILLPFLSMMACRTAMTGSPPAASAQQTPQKSIAEGSVESGILFISGRLSAVLGKAPKTELLAIQRTAGRLKTLPSTKPEGPPPYFGFTTVGTMSMQGYLPHPLHPRLEVQNNQGRLETQQGHVAEAEFSLRLPVQAGMDSIRFFEIDSNSHSTNMATFPL